MEIITSGVVFLALEKETHELLEDAESQLMHSVSSIGKKNARNSITIEISEDRCMIDRLTIDRLRTDLGNLQQKWDAAHQQFQLTADAETRIRIKAKLEYLEQEVKVIEDELKKYNDE